MTPILTSLLDNDFYKITMQQGVTKLFPYAKARYQFINRGHHQFPPGFAQALRQAVDSMAGLKLTAAEKQFLQSKCPYLDPVYLDFLESYCYNPAEVVIEQQGFDLKVSIEGYWYRTILWEVPIMALICELYYQLNHIARINDQEVIDRTTAKFEKYKQLGVTVADFGTRRRHSYQVQQLVLQALQPFGPATFVGTSNVHLAEQYKITPIGTHAHEWFMYHAAHYGYRMANAMALQHWADVYRGDLGIALSDTYTTEVFFRQFDKMFSKLFDGVRHDSGDAIEFAQKVINHYQSLGINPQSKTIIFSDALNYDKVARIAEFCQNKIGMSFGIGTNLTNDAGPTAMNIVIKMTEAQVSGEWIPVVKLSDEHGKYTGDNHMIAQAKDILHIP
ncbi:nicotinate phosphoribosyltransferase [Mucilaginibacter robiniae]|uniref:Nicotinate phosphoribosyltransferase n=1 Tax=Mucilaginibacter robiniae TaxID=2728022 RepID=A0A7L5E6B6_9SPHI|nr:nicotinate phosphoribosyltransferase [Mucilaginibacter robiniae]QJD98178.1 nicotinate phosphoribosyltransferase [Mucilaginibacter robiniae]